MSKWAVLYMDSYDKMVMNGKLSWVTEKLGNFLSLQSFDTKADANDFALKNGGFLIKVELPAPVLEDK